MIKSIHTRWNELLATAETDFPLSQSEAMDFRAHLRKMLMNISSVEREAVDSLQRAVM